MTSTSTATGAVGVLQSLAVAVGLLKSSFIISTYTTSVFWKSTGAQDKKERKQKAYM